MCFGSGVGPGLEREAQKRVGRQLVVGGSVYCAGDGSVGVRIVDEHRNLVTRVLAVAFLVEPLNLRDRVASVLFGWRL